MACIIETYVLLFWRLKSKIKVLAGLGFSWGLPPGLADSPLLAVSTYGLFPCMCAYPVSKFPLYQVASQIGLGPTPKTSF